MSQDRVQRQFGAERPNLLRVADSTYVATDTPLAWRGFASVAFVIDVFSRRIVGGRAHTTMRTELVSDALDQALYDRAVDGRLSARSDRGSQCVTMRDTARLVAAGAAPTVAAWATPATTRSPRA